MNMNHTSIDATIERLTKSLVATAKELGMAYAAKNALNTVASFGFSGTTPSGGSALPVAPKASPARKRSSIGGNKLTTKAVEVLKASGKNGLTSEELRAACGNPGKYRFTATLRKLKASGQIKQKGTKRATRYYSA